jgi:hypothetical protein
MRDATLFWTLSGASGDRFMPSLARGNNRFVNIHRSSALALKRLYRTTQQEVEEPSVSHASFAQDEGM